MVRVARIGYSPDTRARGSIIEFAPMHALPRTTIEVAIAVGFNVRKVTRSAYLALHLPGS